MKKFWRRRILWLSVGILALFLLAELVNSLLPAWSLMQDLQAQPSQQQNVALLTDQTMSSFGSGGKKEWTTSGNYEVATSQSPWLYAFLNSTKGPGQVALQGLRNGRIQWSWSLPKKNNFYIAAMVLGKNDIYVAGSDNTLYAVGKFDGHEKWHRTFERGKEARVFDWETYPPLSSSQIVEVGQQVFVSHAGMVSALDTQTGRLVSEKTIFEDYGQYISVQYDGQGLILLYDRYKVIALQAKTLKKVWSLRIPDAWGDKIELHISGTHAYLWYSDEVLDVDVNNGRVLWKSPLDFDPVAFVGDNLLGISYKTPSASPSTLEVASLRRHSTQKIDFPKESYNYATLEDQVEVYNGQLELLVGQQYLAGEVAGYELYRLSADLLGIHLTKQADLDWCPSSATDIKPVVSGTHVLCATALHKSQQTEMDDIDFSGNLQHRWTVPGELKGIGSLQ